MRVSKYDISINYKRGSDFNLHIDSIKQKIVKVFASTSEIRNDASYRLYDAVNKLIREQVHVMIIEKERDSNAWNVNEFSCLCLMVRGLYIIFFISE